MKKYSTTLLYLGYIAILFSALLYPSEQPVLSQGIQLSTIIMGLGCLALIVYRVLNPLEGDDKSRIKRLEFQLVISSILYLAATYFMYNHERHWIVCLLAAAITDIVIAFRTPNKKN
ncbi:MAG: hypothetical protein IKP81_08135 [Paludibacteraceae bacterium]|nr:hypothetical protein [Paludibacteraceae bacterium]MBR6105011.1 hypothetical protein [Paludibacteraceae bacterium]